MLGNTTRLRGFLKMQPPLVAGRICFPRSHPNCNAINDSVISNKPFFISEKKKMWKRLLRKPHTGQNGISYSRRWISEGKHVWWGGDRKHPGIGFDVFGNEERISYLFLLFYGRQGFPFCSPIFFFFPTRSDTKMRCKYCARRDGRWTTPFLSCRHFQKYDRNVYSTLRIPHPWLINHPILRLSKLTFSF